MIESRWYLAFQGPNRFGGAAMARESTDVLTADEAAKYLRVSLKTLYRLVAAGKVPGQKVGRSWRFRKTDLVAFLQGRP
jgi:excisionase family DNA binding protein